MRKIIALFLVLAFFVSCKQKNEPTVVKKNKSTTVSLGPTELAYKEYNDIEYRMGIQRKVVKEGDTVAYQKLQYMYSYTSRGSELFLYDQIMSTKYSYGEGSYNVYIIYKHYSNENDRFKVWATYYLLRSKEQGYKRGEQQINEIFGSLKKVPTSKKYLIENLDKLD
ncbi:hypothetical protein [Flavobacterium sp.]|uniref:hypothetical protein n=1 Tax=Flavobacterium sp. TaxID=239 RepID=UPI003B9C566B